MQLVTLQRKSRADLASSLTEQQGDKDKAQVVALLNPNQFRKMRRPNRRDGKVITIHHHVGRRWRMLVFLFTHLVSPPPEINGGESRIARRADDESTKLSCAH